MKIFRNLLAAAALAFVGLTGLVTVSPAQAQTITCDAQGVNLNTYPLDGNGVAANTHAYACGPVGQHPSAANTQLMFNALRNAPVPFALSKMKQQGALFFLFRNRSEANSFFANNAPFNANGGYQTSTARCGNTFFHPSVNIIVSAVYETCYLSGGINLTNPALDRTALHEMGHAFAVSLVKGTTKTAPDRIAGFTNLINADIDGQSAPISGNINIGLTPSNWSAYTQAQKNALICNIFGTSVPSALEVEFGSTPNAVCSGSTPVAAYINMTPKDIAVAQNKYPPYFRVNIDVWAEAFATYALGTQSPGNFLPITDHILLTGQGPTVGTIPAPAPMHCARLVVTTWANTLAPPTAGQLYNAKCPTNLGALQ